MINKTLAVLLLSATAAAAQVPATGQQPAVPGQVPGAPGQPIPGQPLPGAKPPAAPPPASATAARTFAAPIGVLFNTVRPDKTADFEKLVAAVRRTLASSTDTKLQAIGKGMKFYKATEPGPGNSVVYVFLVDPTVPGEDYGLGRILSSGSTDTAALQEIWKLYTGSVTSGGTLMNLSPIPEPPPELAPGEKPSAAGGVAPAPK